MTQPDIFFNDLTASRGALYQATYDLEGLRLNIALLNDFMTSINKRLQDQELSTQHQLRLINLLDQLQSEREALENGQLPKPVDSSAAWHLHQKSQSGFQQKT